MSRQKKEEVLKDIKKKQSQFLLMSQMNLAERTSQTNSQRDPTELYGGRAGTCCLCFSWKNRQESSSTDHKSSEGKKIQQAAKQDSGPKQVLPQMDSTEWMNYIAHNLKSFKEQSWSAPLSTFIQEHGHDLPSAKFRGQIYYSNFYQ